MARHVMNTLLLLTALSSVHAYWLMAIENFITTERLDPIVNPGKISGHTHSVLGGSNFRMNTNTSHLRQSECTSVPIPEDKSNYWFPHLYFQWSNGSFSSMYGGAVIEKPGSTTAFPDDFRMLSGDPTLRTYDPNSYAQQAITFLCLDFDGVTTRHNSLPAKVCPSGVRAQVNFPACWDGKNLDSPDHKSHVAFFSGGPDSGACTDPKYPVTLPRIFLEVYWNTADFEKFRSQAKNSTQPFVYSYGDPTGYGYHADFLNGWDKGVLQNAVDKCNCDIYGDPTCCVNQGIFHMNKGKSCRITKTVDEATTGTLSKLPGNNPIQKEGTKATMFADPNMPVLLAPVYVYTGNTPTMIGKPIPPAAGGPASSAIPSSSASPGDASSSSAPSPSSSSAISSSSASPGGTSSSGAAPSSAAVPQTSTISRPPPVSSAVVGLPSFPSPPSVPPPPASGRPRTGNNLPAQSSVTKPGPSAITTPPHTPAVPASNPGGDDEDDEDCDEDDDDEDEHHASSHPSTPSPTPSIPSPGTPSPNTPAPNAPLPPISGTGSNSPKPGAGSQPAAPAPNPAHPDHAPPKPPAVPPAHVTPPAAGHPTGIAQSPATSTGIFLPSVPHSDQPMCAGGKYRHKHLREKLKAQEEQEQKRALHHVRSIHESRHRFTKSHVHHARVF